jgi:UDP-N-acetylglucosamine 1-carboxyvinyltransferase
MASFQVEGGRPLCGEVRVSAAKNAVLPVMAAALLTAEPVTIARPPHLTDVQHMAAILRDLGCQVDWDGGQMRIAAISPAGQPNQADVRALRASILVLGPMLARTGCAEVALPGGCAIGNRPIDLHLKGLALMGAQLDCQAGRVTARGSLTGCPIFLDLPSVGATENLMMAACLARGVTRIENAAREPEVTELARCLNRMGARVRGGGTSCVEIEGVHALHGADLTIMPDRIEAGTLLCALGAAGGEIALKSVQPPALSAVLEKLSQMGLRLRTERSRIFAAGRALHPVQLATGAFPGFPTDLQAPMMALAALCPGDSLLVESVFENRFMHAQELARMGADIRIEGRSALVRGGSLAGAEVCATDLRAGAALVVAALGARGQSVVERAELIERGYDGLDLKLNRLGARVSRLPTAP